MAMQTEAAGFSFADILAPITPETFFAENCGQQWVHIPGDADKFPDVLNWDSLTELLNKSGVWSSATLGLVQDRKGVPILDYCYSTKTPDGQDVYRPDGPRVMGHLRKGASLVANDIDSLTPGLTALATVLEQTLSAKVQANLYCSWKEHQAFDSHFDTHDVYAIQLEGEKLWHIYEGCLDNPIAHSHFHDMTPDQHEEMKGRLEAELIMRPGDVIYLPRGHYHDAIAVTGNSMHVTFGAVALIGLDYLNALLPAATSDPLFRADCPRPAEGRQRLAAYLAELAERASDIGASDAFAGEMAAWQRSFLYPRGGFDLPVELEQEDFRVRAGFDLVWKNGQALLSGPRGALPVPAGLEEAVAWVVGHERFTRSDFAEAAPAMDPAARSKLLGDLVNMKVLEQG